jgi:hypothetical protein
MARPDTHDTSRQDTVLGKKDPSLAKQKSYSQNQLNFGTQKIVKALHI